MTFSLIQQLNQQSTVLLEYSHDITLQKFGAGLVDKAKKDSTAKALVKNPSALLKQIEIADPTNHKEYVQWLVRTYISTPIKLEDIQSTMGDALQKFNTLKIRKMLPPEARDINRLKTPDQLHQVVDSLADKIAKKEEDDKGKYEVLYDGPNVRLVKLMDYKAAKYFGRGTRWCTAAENNNMFDYYQKHYKDSDMIAVLPKKPLHPQEKYQLHLGSRQCKDSKDDTFKFPRLLERFPELVDVFKKMDKFKELDVLQRTKEEREQLKAKRLQQEQQREQEIDDFLKSLQR